MGLLFTSAIQEEGMFPLSHLNKVDFKKAGFKITQKDVFNPDGVSLTDALVRLGGCTGSFVSDEGLIITNHHCVFSSVAAVSSSEQDYLTKGFMAKTKSNELKTSLPCRITESYKDVSAEVLKGTNGLSPAEKAKVIRANQLIILEKERAKYPDLEIKISEMFVGKSYTLFRYLLLEDVRLVYVPPRNIGEFGRETDNWEWPRHTGDFSLVRAYVGKDGKPAKYSEDNVPYNPKKHLQVKTGAKENDLAFILGYPGRTYKNRTSEFLEYQYSEHLPFYSEWFSWRIDHLTSEVKNDRDAYLQVAGRMKSWANVEKNYNGKIQGLRRTDVIKNKKMEEIALEKYAKKNLPQYKDAFRDMRQMFKMKKEEAKKTMLMGRFLSDISTFSTAYFIASKRLELDTVDNKEAYLKANKEKWLKQLKRTAPAYNNAFDKKSFLKLMDMYNMQKRPANLIGWIENASHQIYSLNGTQAWGKKGHEDFIHKYYSKTKLLDRKQLIADFEKNPMKVISMKDKLVNIALRFVPEYQAFMESYKNREDKINSILPEILEIKMAYNKEGFIPDANATLRFTYGYLKGYSPMDGIINYPFTSTDGIKEKANTNEDYVLEQDILKAMDITDISPKLKDPKTGKVVVGMLYNMDTSGGNSGSPILDDSGNLIGVNFDRAYTATINDYAWNESYSRSIGVDIRYVLFVMKYYSKADHIIKEMNVIL